MAVSGSVSQTGRSLTEAAPLKKKENGSTTKDDKKSKFHQAVHKMFFPNQNLHPAPNKAKERAEKQRRQIAPAWLVKSMTDDVLKSAGNVRSLK